MDDAKLSDYQSNNDNEGYITNSEVERSIVQLANKMKGQQYRP